MFNFTSPKQYIAATALGLLLICPQLAFADTPINTETSPATPEVLNNPSEPEARAENPGHSEEENAQEVQVSVHYINKEKGKPLSYFSSQGTLTLSPKTFTFKAGEVISLQDLTKAVTGEPRKSGYRQFFTEVPDTPKEFRIVDSPDHTMNITIEYTTFGRVDLYWNYALNNKYKSTFYGPTGGLVPNGSLEGLELGYEKDFSVDLAPEEYKETLKKDIEDKDLIFMGFKTSDTAYAYRYMNTNGKEAYNFDSSLFPSSNTSIYAAWAFNTKVRFVDESGAELKANESFPAYNGSPIYILDKNIKTIHTLEPQSNISPARLINTNISTEISGYEAVEVKSNSLYSDEFNGLLSNPEPEWDGPRDEFRNPIKAPGAKPLPVAGLSEEAKADASISRPKTVLTIVYRKLQEAKPDPSENPNPLPDEPDESKQPDPVDKENKDPKPNEHDMGTTKDFSYLYTQVNSLKKEDNKTQGSKIIKTQHHKTESLPKTAEDSSTSRSLILGIIGITSLLSACFLRRYEQKTKA